MAYRSNNILSTVLTTEQIEEISRKKDKGKSVSDLAKEYEVHRNTIYNVLNRWKFENARSGTEQARKDK